jgi:hypothetical protein
MISSIVGMFMVFLFRELQLQQLQPEQGTAWTWLSSMVIIPLDMFRFGVDDVEHL